MCDTCKQMLTDVPPKDWKLTTIRDRGPGSYPPFDEDFRELPEAREAMRRALADDRG